MVDQKENFEKIRGLITEIGSTNKQIVSTYNQKTHVKDGIIPDDDYTIGLKVELRVLVNNESISYSDLNKICDIASKLRKTQDDIRIDQSTVTLEKFVGGLRKKLLKCVHTEGYSLSKLYIEAAIESGYRGKVTFEPNYIDSELKQVVKQFNKAIKDGKYNTVLSMMKEDGLYDVYLFEDRKDRVENADDMKLMNSLAEKCGMPLQFTAEEMEKKDKPDYTPLPPLKRGDKTGRVLRHAQWLAERNKVRGPNGNNADHAEELALVDQKYGMKVKRW